MYYKYNVEDLKYIESLKHKRKAVVYYDGNKKKYVDVNNNTVISNHNQRLYDEENIRLIGSLNKILSCYDMWVLLIDAQGKKNTKITAEVINDLISMFERIRSFDDSLIKEIEYISSLLTNICISNLYLSKNKEIKDNEFDIVITGSELDLNEKEEIMLRKLIFNYIFIDTAINGITERNLVITKENKMIDYKILRILKYLGININIEDIPNFKIEYNLKGITYFDSKGNKTANHNLDKEEEKVKKFVDKRSIKMYTI